MEVANSVNSIAKEEAGNFGSRMAIMIYKTVWREEHLQAHKENGKSQE